MQHFTGCFFTQFKLLNSIYIILSIVDIVYSNVSEPTIECLCYSKCSLPTSLFLAKRGDRLLLNVTFVRPASVHLSAVMCRSTKETQKYNSPVLFCAHMFEMLTSQMKFNCLIVFTEKALLGSISLRNIR